MWLDCCGHFARMFLVPLHVVLTFRVMCKILALPLSLRVPSWLSPFLMRLSQQYMLFQLLKKMTFRYCWPALGLPLVVLSSTCLVYSDFLKDTLYTMSRYCKFRANSSLGITLLRKKHFLPVKLCYCWQMGTNYVLRPLASKVPKDII